MRVLVVDGPEAAPVAGVVDALEKAGVPAFGPAERDGEIVTAGGGVLNLTALAAPLPRRAIARTMRRAGSPSTECRSAPTLQPARSSASPATRKEA